MTTIRGKYSVFDGDLEVANYKTKQSAMKHARGHEGHTVGLCFTWAGSTRITQMWDHTGRRLRFESTAATTEPGNDRH